MAQQQAESPSWHTLDVPETLRRLGTDAQAGLPEDEVAARRARYGLNELVERAGKSPWRILLEQFTSVLIIVLIVAALVSALLGDLTDAVAILAIVILNALLGFVQEFRAEKALAALKRMAAPIVRVRRGGAVLDVPARDLVPGDIVLLEAGNAVPADARLLEVANLRTQESALTGESQTVDKELQAHDAADAPLGDRRDMVYMGTVVTYGRGVAAVTSTGMATELGHIAELIQKPDVEPTPLQKRMAQLGRQLAGAALIVVAIVFVLGLLRGENARDLFLTAVAMGVAAVPEGLPAVITILLALGAQRMLKRKALIRKLPAVETLGSVTVICSDKTGTLTENRMTVVVLDVAGHTANLDATMQRDMPVLEPGAGHLHPAWASHALMLAGAALCNDAVLQETNERGEHTALGDPTEGALLVAAARMGLWQDHLQTLLPRVAEAPFSSERKRMTTVHRVDRDAIRSEDEQVLRPLFTGTHGYVSFTKGGVDSMLGVCSHVWDNGKLLPVDEHWRGRIHSANDTLAADGLRVLGVGLRWLDALPEPANEEVLEQEIAFVGMVGMIDPPRPEVRDAVLTCKAAGIRPVMITGDHPLTALQIARELHIAGDDGQVLTGQQLAGISEEELKGIAARVPVFARVSPEHKLSIVQALQTGGEVVAMTGDGVNDAPALRKADIGVAMGITGTDVSKEAADMVILDDNFATIVSAVEEGRRIYANIRKFVTYAVTSNTGEILVMVAGPLLGMPLPLTALQILFINLVTDGLPGLALSAEPAERDAMQRPPVAKNESLFTRSALRHMLWVGTFMAAVALAIGYWAWSGSNPAWQTMIFTVLSLSQMANALAIRSDRDSLFRIGLLSNKPLLAAVMGTLLLQIVILYIPITRLFLRLEPLTLLDLLLVLVASTLVLWVTEVEKWWRRRAA